MPAQNIAADVGYRFVFYHVARALRDGFGDVAQIRAGGRDDGDFVAVETKREAALGYGFIGADPYCECIAVLPSCRRDGGEIESRQVHLRFAVFAVESADYRVPDFSLAPCEAALILGEVEVYLVYIARAVS